jgi:hypothetical protein
MRVIWLRLMMYLSAFLLLFLLLALMVGNQLSGEHVAAFTPNSYKTRSMYVFDTEHGINLYFEFSGHENELPVWSAQAHGIVFHPRNQLNESPVKP